MFKTEFFSEETLFNLQRHVNEFIKDKIVVNISYTVTTYKTFTGTEIRHCCCVLYNSAS